MHFRSIDLSVCVGGGLLIFEIKSANERNFEKQARSGIIQILECKMKMEREYAGVSPVLVISSISSAEREGYMKMLAESVGVAMASYQETMGEFVSLDEMIRNRGRVR